MDLLGKNKRKPESPTPEAKVEQAPQPYTLEELKAKVQKGKEDDIPIPYPTEYMEGDMVRLDDSTLITLEEWNQSLSSLELKNDIVFGFVMTNIEVVTPIVQEILGDDGAEVLSVEAQAPTLHLVQRKGEPLIKDIKESEVSRLVLDVLAKCSNGDIVAFELQNLPDGRGPLGSRGISILSTLVRDSQIGKGNTKYELSRTVSVFLVGYEWDSKAPAMENFVMTSRQRGTVLTDAQEIVIVKYNHFWEIGPDRLQVLCSILANNPFYSEYGNLVHGCMNSIKQHADISKEVSSMNIKEVGKKELQESFAATLLQLLKAGKENVECALVLLRGVGFSEEAAEQLLNSWGYQV